MSYGLKHDFAASDRRNTLIIRMTRISILLKSVPFMSDNLYNMSNLRTKAFSKVFSGVRRGSPSGERGQPGLSGDSTAPARCLRVASALLQTSRLVRQPGPLVRPCWWGVRHFAAWVPETCEAEVSCYLKPFFQRTPWVPPDRQIKVGGMDVQKIVLSLAKWTFVLDRWPRVGTLCA